MTPHLLLRLVIYAIGLRCATDGIVQFFYYTHLGLTDPFDPASKLISHVLSYAAVPLVLAFGCLGFGRAITIHLLGPEPAQIVTLQGLASDATFRLLLKAVGVYVFATTIGPAVATVFEMFALRVGNNRLDEAKVVPDAVSNGLSLAAAYMLTLQTDKIVALIKSNTETK